MGTLATRLNAPVTVEVCGETLKVRRLSIAAIYRCVEDGLREKQADLSGMALQDAAQECIDGGRYPVNALVKIVHEACRHDNEAFDVTDAEALCVPSNLEHGRMVSRVALGEDPEKEGAEKNPEAANGGKE